MPSGGVPLELPTPIDQGAFLEAIGIDPAEVERNTTEIAFDEDLVKVTWTGFKYVPIGKLIYALTEADEEMKRRAGAMARTKATPPKRAVAMPMPMGEEAER